MRRDLTYDRQAFLAHELPGKIRDARVGAIIIAIFVGGASALDYAVYPNYTAEFFWVRMFCAMATISIYFILRSEKLEALHDAASSVILYPVIVVISYMVYRTDGVNSPYYVGLILAMIGLSVVLKWSPFYSAGVSLLILLIYTAAILLHGKGFELSSVVNNYFFLVVNAVIVVAGSYFYEKTRISEFLLIQQTVEQSDELELSNERLKELDKVKTDFFANISHELRTPLTIILGNCDRLLDVLRNTENKRLVVPLRENGLRLLSLIDNLLELVRFDQSHQRVNRSAVDVRQFFDRFIVQVQPLADRKSITLLDEIGVLPSSLRVDEQKIERIINNLFINAVKFTAESGEIVLGGSYSEGVLKLMVSDNGVGMSENSQKKIFDRFWQVNSGANRKFRGTGIGLSLVDTLVKAMEGKIVVESALGKGTSFTISIPASESDKKERQEETEISDVIEDYHREASYSIAGMEYQTEKPVDSVPEGSAGPKQEDDRKLLMVADDEPQLRAFIVECLQQDYRIVEAKDGYEAEQLGKQYEPDLFVVDYMMPEMDGIELTRLLKKHQSLREKPVVMLTARADQEMKIKALAAGVADFMAKPFSPLELQLRVKNILSQEEFRMEAEQKRKDLRKAMEELKESEAKLLQNEKLAAMGRMSAGLIHEINNPLNYAKTAAGILERKYKAGSTVEPDEGLDFLVDISEGVDRVSKIIADLRGLATDSSKSMNEVNLLEVAQKSERMVADQLAEFKVKLTINIDEGIRVKANELQLSQVFINMFQNAILAIREKDDNVRNIDVMAREMINETVLSIRDSGCGIPSDKLEMIYEPFYTSREVGSGMGMGLSIVRQIIESFKAELNVESEVGNYTEFTMVFPLIKKNNN